MSLRIAQASLFCLTLLGAYALHGFSNVNGFWDRVAESSKKKLYPDSNIRCPTSFTGIQPIDEGLLTFLMFFWPTVDGNHPDLSLASFLFAGQCVSILAVVLVEGARHGNKGRLVSYTFIYAFFVQTIGFAVLAPAYLLLHLFTSPTVRHPSAKTLSLDEGFLTGIPFGLLVGFILPTALMSLPAPNFLSEEHKAQAVLVWQMSPIYAIIYAYVWKVTLWPNIKYSSELEAQQNQKLLLRLVYLAGLICGTVVHIAAVTLSVSAYLIPGLFAAGTGVRLQPHHAFLPPSPFSDMKASSIAQGALWFIQWDYLISSAAYVIWAVTLRSAHRREQFHIGMLFDALARIAIIGPMATALTYVWQRDECVFEQVETPSSKKSR